MRQGTIASTLFGLLLLSAAQDAVLQTVAFRLEDGTPVRLKLKRNLSSADAQAGDRVDFDVLDEIAVNGIVLIPKGSVALGTVTEAQAKRRCDSLTEKSVRFAQSRA